MKIWFNKNYIGNNSFSVGNFVLKSDKAHEEKGK